jgi:hypothetical protein
MIDEQINYECSVEDGDPDCVQKTTRVIETGGETTETTDEDEVDDLPEGSFFGTDVSDADCALFLESYLAARHTEQDELASELENVISNTTCNAGL